MAERVRVREISNEEGNRLLRIVRRSSGSVVTWRRAQMVLLSAQGMDVAQNGSAAGRRRASVVAVHAGDGELSVLAVVADRVPASAFLAGERVEAVVGHDIEAVLALHDVGHARGHRRLRSQPEELVAQIRTGRSDRSVARSGA